MITPKQLIQYFWDEAVKCLKQKLFRKGNGA